MEERGNEKFDGYVKKLFSEEERVPAGLEWEEMDIELPEQKKKRRDFFC